MIDLTQVIAFFNKLAPKWDSSLIRSEEVIKRILDNANVVEGSRVLDVACGTGVLIPDYLRRGAGSIIAVDISPEMIRIASEKFPQENITFICSDVETAELPGGFDSIVVYNAFPHFQDGRRLIVRLAALLAEGGTLSVAHDMSREALLEHHKGVPDNVANSLLPIEELKTIFSEVLEISAMISDDTMYQLSGRRKTS